MWILSSKCCNRDADKQEDIAAEAHRERQALLESEGGASGNIAAMHIDDANDCVLRIGASGVIQMANKNVLKLLGYKKVTCKSDIYQGPAHSTCALNYL